VLPLARLARIARFGGRRRRYLLSLMLGAGQRPAQMLRARLADVDLPARTITLHDGKGKRQVPRVHNPSINRRSARAGIGPVRTPLAADRGRPARTTRKGLQLEADISAVRGGQIIEADPATLVGPRCASSDAP